MRRLVLAGLVGLLAAASACVLGFDGDSYIAGGPRSSASEGGTEAGQLAEAGAADVVASDANGTLSKACAQAGDRCADGSVYVGPGPDGKVLYTSPCDYGQSLAPSPLGSCTGVRTLLSYNDGNVSGGVFVGATSPSDGAANTAKLIATDADKATQGMQPHQAAVACASFALGDHQDWYLPAQDELRLLFENRAALKAFDSSFYWSATETHGPAEPLNAAAIQFSDGYEYGDGDKKPDADPVRCVRKNP